MLRAQKLTANLNIATATAEELSKFGSTNFDVVEQLAVQFLTNTQVSNPDRAF